MRCCNVQRWQQAKIFDSVATLTVGGGKCKQANPAQHNSATSNCKHFLAVLRTALDYITNQPPFSFDETGKQRLLAAFKRKMGNECELKGCYRDERRYCSSGISLSKQEQRTALKALLKGLVKHCGASQLAMVWSHVDNVAPRTNRKPRTL